MFVPQPLKPVQVDKVTAKLYSVIDSTMKPPKRAHSFQINKTAIAASGIDCQLKLDTLGTQLNLSAIVNSVISDWPCHFHRNWSNFAELTILTFHNEAGKQVDDTTTATDLAVLLPIQDKSIPDCCKKHIWFV
jgi:hypothetical protein